MSPRARIVRCLAVLLMQITLVQAAWVASAAAGGLQLPFNLPSLPGQKPKTPADGSGTDLTKLFTQGAGCLLVGGGAALLAKNFADKDAQRLKLTPADAKKRETGYMVGFGLLGCAGGAAIAGTAYDKMSAQGKKNRMDALQKAADSGRTQSYTDPENPSMTGTVTPGTRVADAGNKECVDTEDVWANGTPALSKMCRVVGTSEWKPEVG